MLDVHGELISFRGMPGAGKTFAADHYVRDYAAARVGFADVIKAEAYERVVDRRTLPSDE